MTLKKIIKDSRNSLNIKVRITNKVVETESQCDYAEGQKELEEKKPILAYGVYVQNKEQKKFGLSNLFDLIENIAESWMG